MADDIILAPYDPAWPGIFTREAALLCSALPDGIVAGIEHIGSTAVPGLGAKPIVDIALGLHAGALTPPQECWKQLGYEPGHPEEHSSEWLYYVKRNSLGERVAHLHVVIFDGMYWQKWIRFRDRLLADPALAREYLDLKRDLAKRYRDDRLRYTVEKAPFVARAIAPWRANVEDLALRATDDRALVVREEVRADIDAIRAVHLAAFGRGAEGLLVDRLRDDGLIVTSLVVIADGRCVGSVVFSKLTIRTVDGDISAVALAPMAVAPDHQGQGIGSQLIIAGLEQCKALGLSVVLVLGHPDYYKRFGFSAELAKRIEGPYSGEAWMAMELRHDALPAGPLRVVYPRAFDAVD